MTRIDRSESQLDAEAAAPRDNRSVEAVVIEFPKDDRWLICGCRKCEARRAEGKRVG